MSQPPPTAVCGPNPMFCVPLRAKKLGTKFGAQSTLAQAETGARLAFEASSRPMLVADRGISGGTGAFVDGSVEPIGDDALTITDPATGAEVGRVTGSSAATVDRAARSAQEAFGAWSRRASVCIALKAI